MRSQLRQLLHAYTSRRSPWGPPWWIYAVTFGAANLVRQGVVDPGGPPTNRSASLSYVATAVVVIAVINSTAVSVGKTRRRRSAGTALVVRADLAAPPFPRTPSGAEQPPASPCAGC